MSREEKPSLKIENQLRPKRSGARIQLNLVVELKIRAANRLTEMLCVCVSVTSDVFVFPLDRPNDDSVAYLWFCFCFF